MNLTDSFEMESCVWIRPNGFRHLSTLAALLLLERMFSVDGSALDYVPLTLRKFSDVFLFLHHLKILLSLENQLPNFPLHSSIRISIPHHSKLYLSELPALILKSVLWTELLHLIHQLAIMWFE